MNTHGIHHVTAIAASARRNLQTYTGLLGLRLVKKTVNFDDTGTYHLYFGDGEGSPGTILTFFPWEHAAPARFGAGETRETAFRIPEASLGWWLGRLADAGVEHDLPRKRFGATVIAFRAPDGMRLALVGLRGIEGEPGWSGGGVPAEHAIRGFHGVSLLVRDPGPSAAILTGVLGFAEIGREGETRRLAVPGNPIGGVVDLVTGDTPPGRQGAGSVHHVAFRAADDAAQAAMVDTLARDHGIQATEQRDRTYFRSVYFREPGGVLFEIATDVPGFAVDEPAAELGRALMLPARLEPRRAELEAALPALT